MHAQNLLLEKLSTLAMTGGYGGCMVALFMFSNSTSGGRSMLSLLAGWIQWAVLLSGVLLLILFAIQLVTLWTGLARMEDAHAGHDHGDDDHDHHHGHGHHHHASGEKCDHDHGHDHHHHAPGEKCDHDHAPASKAQPPGTHHDEHHEHGDVDHSHGWVPSRYIPLVVPLLFCLMGIPKEDQIQAYERALIDKDLRGDSSTYMVPQEASETTIASGLTQMALDPLSPAGLVSVGVGRALELLEEQNLPPPEKTDLGRLEIIANDPGSRERWAAYRNVEVEGIFAPGGRSADGRTLMRIVRLRVACCLGDARPAMMVAMTREQLPEFPPNQWVAVSGRLTFFQTKDGWRAGMRAVKTVPKPTPPRPYLD
jgi:hypothetical protein